MAYTSNIVYQISTSTGTGNFSLTSLTGYIPFSTAFSTSTSSNRFYYCIRHITANEYEIGEGYLSGGALVRHTVLKSSNSDNLVNFSTGTKEVVNDIPASLQEQLVTLTADLAGKANSSHTHAISDVTGLQTALDGKVDENASITGATKTKITYDAKGLVTAGADATTADIADSTNRRYVTDAQLIVIGNTSGTNTGDQTNITGNAGTVTTINGLISAGSNVTITGSGTSGSPYNISSSGGGTPNGSDTYVQFNDGGSFGGDAGFTYNKTSDVATVGGINLFGQAANKLAIFDGSKNVISADTATYPTLTEISYVKGVTSTIQTQIDAKQPFDSDLTALASNGTNGIWARTGSGTGSARTITAGTGISVTNGNGVSGDPTISSTITQYTNSDALAAVSGAGYITSVNVDGKSVTGDGNATALESHTKYDQEQSVSYALQDSDNDKVFDDTVGGCIYSLTELTTFPFSATFVNINGNTISIDVSGCNIYIGGVNYTTIASINTQKKGSSLKMRIHLDHTKVYLEPFGEWDMVT